MKPNYIHIAMVLDRSGSMDSCRDVTIEGFNSFLTKQKEHRGEGTVTLVQFDDRYEINYDFLPLQNAPLLNHQTYSPRGMTALLDAIGRTIDSTGARLAALPEDQRPSRVIFVIQTDGFENSSTEYVGPVFRTNVCFPIAGDKSARVREMVKHQQEKYNWDFVFLGAGQDAILTAQEYGINAKSSLTYDVGNTRRAFAAAANYVSSYCSAPTLDAAKMCCFTKEDRDESVVGLSNATTTTNNSTSTSKIKKPTVTAKV